MEELLNKIIEITKEVTILRLENESLKEECNRLDEMNNYYFHRYEGKL